MEHRLPSHAAHQGPARVVRRGSFRLPCSPAVALPLFTPEGERRWVSGWHPHYLSGAGDEAGAVWRTSHGEDTTTWITTDRDDDRVRYARISGNGTAGLVEVRCRPADGGTTVQVTYDLTACTAAGRDALAHFAAQFDDMLGHWEEATAAALAGSPATPDSAAEPGRRHLGRVFEEVPALYDRVRPGYPDELFADLAAIAGLDRGSSVLEVGAGTGKATRGLAALGGSVTALEPGPGLAALARERLAGVGDVAVETSAFEDWDDRGRRFDLIVAAASWHWVDPAVGWRRAHELLRPGGWLALLGNVVVRRPGEPEVYAETADLHERFSPGNPGWGHPPLEDDVRGTDQGWGEVEDPGDLFGPTVVRWYPTVQEFTGAGFADLLRSTSLYRELAEDVREPLLDAVAERIRVRMGDRATRRYLTVLRAGRRSG